MSEHEEAHNLNFQMILRFNSFTKQLDDGYLENRHTHKPVGKDMTPERAYQYLAEHPKMAVVCLMV